MYSTELPLRKNKKLIKPINKIAPIIKNIFFLFFIAIYCYNFLFSIIFFILFIKSSSEISFFKKSITINPYKLGYWLGSNDLEKKQNLFYTELKSLNLIKNKHIPYNYKCNLKKIRLELLAGIIDSCAELTENGYYMILDSLLAMDIIYLCNSIGILSKYDNVISIFFNSIFS